MAKATEPTPAALEAIYKETGKLVLVDIRLVEVNSKLGTIKPEALPGKATQSVSLTLGTEEGPVTVGVAVGSFSLVLNYNMPAEGDPAWTLHARFKAKYTYKAKPSKKHSANAVKAVMLSTLWPYWREFAQSMAVRMGLPAVPVPFFNPFSMSTTATPSSCGPDDRRPPG